MHAQTVSMLTRESTLPIPGVGVSRDLGGGGRDIGAGGVTVGGVGVGGAGVGGKLSHAQAAMAAGLPPGGFPGVNEKGGSSSSVPITTSTVLPHFPFFVLLRPLASNADDILWTVWVLGWGIIMVVMAYRPKNMQTMWRDGALQGREVRREVGPGAEGAGDGV